MKKISIIAGALGLLCLSSCANLDLNPLSAASSENWYSTPEEVRISLNDFYRSDLYLIEQGWSLDRQTDDWSQRTNIYPIPGGTFNATTTGSINVATTWSYS